MFWRKLFHVLVISVLLMGAFVSPSTAEGNKAMVKAPLAKQLATTYTVCASGCDFSSIQTAIDSVSAGDTLNLAAETFTESITVDKSLNIIGVGAESTIVQAASAQGIADDRVVNIDPGISVTIQDLTIRYGKAKQGVMPPVSFCGGIENDGNLSLLQVILTKNSSTAYGGGICNSGTLDITNSIISENVSGDGGGIRNDGDASLINVTIFNNSAPTYNGGGVYNIGTITIANSILWGNSADQSSDQIYNSASSMISYTDIQDSGGSGTGWDTSLGTDGGGNIDADPLFVDPTSSDLHLSVVSPAIDAGDNSVCPGTDLDGVPRPQGSDCDLGAYEYEPYLDVAKSLDNPTPDPGETITFTIQVGNFLIDPLNNGLISDTLPAGLNFIGPITLDPPLSGTVGLDPPTLVTDLGIDVGQYVTVTFPVSVSLELAGGTIITNTAWVTGSETLVPFEASAALYIPTNHTVCATGCDFSTIQSAIDSAYSDDTIYVATGIYTGTGSEVVLINKSVNLVGGWDSGSTIQTAQNSTSTIDGEDERRGIYVNDTVTANVTHFTILNGYTDDGNGGGIYNNGILTISNSTIKENFAEYSGYDDHGGGGVFNIGDLTILDSTVRNNIATDSGGGIYGTTGSSNIIRNTHIYANQVDNNEGGGVQLDYDCTLEMYNSWIVGNVALGNDVGGVGVKGGSAYIENSIIAGNFADGGGGGLWFFTEGSYKILNSHIVGNEANDDGAAIMGGESSQIAITNTLIISNTGITGLDDQWGGAELVLNYCDTFGNSPDSNLGVTITRTNCLGTLPEDGIDPLMVGGALPNGVGPTYADQWLNYDYHLQEGSPAIDAGYDGACPVTDLEGILRPQGESCDIGAYEYIEDYFIYLPLVQK